MSFSSVLPKSMSSQTFSMSEFSRIVLMLVKVLEHLGAAVYFEPRLMVV